MSLMTRSPLIYNVHNKLQLLRPLRRGRTCLETSFSATFCEPGKPFPVTIRSIRYLQSCNFSYTIPPSRPHIFCAPRSNLLPLLLTKRPPVCPTRLCFSSCLSIVQERFVHNQAYVRHELSAGENTLFGRYVELSPLFLVKPPCTHRSGHLARLTFQRTCVILKSKDDCNAGIKPLLRYHSKNAVQRQ